MSFLRRSPAASSPSPSPAATAAAGFTKLGSNGALLVSTGVADLDKLIGGGIPMGKLVIVLEDIEAPHHLLLLRYFMAQGVSHGQAILFGSALAAPKSFLATLPAPSTAAATSREDDQSKQGLRIAWQYRKYETQEQQEQHQAAYVSSFDIRKSWNPNSSNIQCFSFQGAKEELLLRQFKEFAANLTASQKIGRIALHSLCAPQCVESCSEWGLLSCLVYLKALLQAANAVALVTIPTQLLSSSFSKRWQHLADILLSVKALPEEDQSKVASFLDYRETVGLLHVHKLSSSNTQVPLIPESAAYAIKILKKKELVLEQLQLAPVAGAELGGSCNSSGNTADY